MKIRTGFVSNSSSSSFIVSDRDYATLFDLAKEMLRIRGLDGDWENIETEKINQAFNKGKDPDTSIYFITCNYDTFIMRTFNNYIVNTCNNHGFVNYINTVRCPEAVEIWLKANGYWNEDSDSSWSLGERIKSWELECGETFWSPEYDLEISRYDYFNDKVKIPYCKSDQCKKNFSKMMIYAPTGEKICPICFSKEQKIKKKKEQKRISRFEILDFGD